MWRSGELADVRGGLSEQLIGLLTLFEELWADQDEPATEDERLEADEALQADEQLAASLFVPPPPGELPSELQQQAQQVNQAFAEASGCYLEAIGLLRDFVACGDPELPSQVREAVARASARLEQADALGQKLGEEEGGGLDAFEAS